MFARQKFAHGGTNRMARLLALVSFLLVLVSGTHRAYAARPPAPMCAPDAQSMPAPLQRTATSDAEIRRGSCPTTLGPSWDVLPNQPNLPLNWWQFVGDPLWLCEVSVRAPHAAVTRFAVVEPRVTERPGVANGVFRPPEFNISS